MSSRFLRLAAAAFAVAATSLTLAPDLLAQKLARTFTEVPEHGFKFKALDGYDRTPTGGRTDPAELLSFEKYPHSLTIYAFENVAAVSDDGTKKEGEEGEDGERKRPKRPEKKRELMPLLERYSGLGALEGVPTFQETVEIEDLQVVHKRFIWEYEDVVNGQTGRVKVQPRCLDVWTFPLKHADIHFVYFVGFEEFDTRWEQTIERSAESFELIERVVPEEIDTSERDYDAQLAWAEQEAARNPGWRAIGTPSKRFVILTSAEKDTFIKEVIQRLEVSRDIYEKDFPPPKSFDAVSVVRICKDRDEFMRFSGMGGGAAGYFSPQSVELVLYDDVSVNRNSSYAVMSHEAFHQYTHFLFDEAEAHRWFDEGHGDYYGGLDIRGKRGTITPRMPAGLDRYPIIKEMMREGSTVPLEEHLNFSHSEWQARGVPSYAQSWSIIYMLRQGMIGKVPRTYWRKEYEDIIPNYVETLFQGYQDAYAEILAEREEIAKERGTELTPKERKINRFMLDPRKKDKIWKAAMEASWGKIDLAEFEANWKAYVEKALK